ncbi:MAG: hypothetical protein WBH14_07820 [Albidovulum sp.]
MIHFPGISTSAHKPVFSQHPTTNLGPVVQRHIQALRLEGYEEIDVRWNSVALCIEAKNGDNIVRLECDPTGRTRSERVVGPGVVIKRTFAADGLTAVSEEIIDILEDR